MGSSSGKAGQPCKQCPGQFPRAVGPDMGKWSSQTRLCHRASSESGSKASPMSVGKTCTPDMKPYVCRKLLSLPTSDPLLKILPHPSLWVQHRTSLKSFFNCSCKFYRFGLSS